MKILVHLCDLCNIVTVPDNVTDDWKDAIWSIMKCLEQNYKKYFNKDKNYPLYKKATRQKAFKEWELLKPVRGKLFPDWDKHNEEFRKIINEILEEVEKEK